MGQQSQQWVPVAASFRDPSGYVFCHDGTLYRAVRESYIPHYRRLLDSGLYTELVRRHLIIPHEEVKSDLSLPGDVRIILRPDRVRYISYVHEWCFHQLQDAALATLEIQQLALDFGMTLKDASTSNIQFHLGRPTLIDTLSFEILAEGKPWIAYNQFCRQFLAPLALQAMRDGRLHRLTDNWPEGMPLDLVKKLLPRRGWLKPGVAIHLFGHSHVGQKKPSVLDGSIPPRTTKLMSLNAFKGLVQSLVSAVKGFRLPSVNTTWSDYYDAEITAPDYLAAKEEIVGEILRNLAPDTVWDLGGNDGRFSRIATRLGSQSVCFDLDHRCVDENYRRTRKEKEPNLLPLILDLSNPSSSRGWDNQERLSWNQRGHCDVVMALALVHHLAIGHNIPLGRLAVFFAPFSQELIVEWIPKTDSKVRFLLARREDIFSDYTRDSFCQAFEEHFNIVNATSVGKSDRVIYHMRRRRTSTALS